MALQQLIINIVKDIIDKIHELVYSFKFVINVIIVFNKCHCYFIGLVFF